MSDVINAKLADFSNLCSLYTFGSERSLATGINIDKCLQQQKRASLIPVFTHGAKLSIGPLSAPVLPELESEGEESDVEITELVQTDPKAILHKTLADGKGGPRIRTIVDQIIEPEYLKPVQVRIPE